jgi:hypothetical protein
MIFDPEDGGNMFLVFIYRVHGTVSQNMATFILIKFGRPLNHHYIYKYIHKYCPYNTASSATGMPWSTV